MLRGNGMGQEWGSEGERPCRAVRAVRAVAGCPLGDGQRCARLEQEGKKIGASTYLEVELPVAIAFLHSVVSQPGSAQSSLVRKHQ